MIITKMSLPRRTVLRGIGATLALPLLDAMVPALFASAKTAANPVRRLGFIYIPNGARMDKWTPPGAGVITELSPILTPLAPFRDQLIIPTNLEQQPAMSKGDGNGQHSRANAAWLSATRPKKTEGSDVLLAATVDQIAAQQLCKDTRLPSLELTLEPNFLVGNCGNGYSCVYVNCMSWRTPTMPLPMENNPRLVFERLFGEGGTAEDFRAERRTDRSILDSVMDDMTRLQKSLGAGDRVKVAEYVDAVREVERRITKAEEQAGKSDLVLPDLPVAIPESFEEYAKLMFDLQVLAYQADVTRVFTFMLGREQSSRTYQQIGVNDGHHAVSHHQDDPAKLAMIQKINTYHVTLLAYFLNKLKSVSDGEGNLLDHSMILYGSGMSDGNLHDNINLPLVVAGGGAGRLKGGRHIKYAEPTPMANLLIGLLDKAGVHLDQFGDSTGRIDLEPLTLS